MKKNKNKKFFFSKIIGFILLTLFFTGIVHGIDVIGDYIKKQTSSGIGTNNNHITFSHKKTTYYIDTGSDGKIEGNKFLGYYYDNIYGFFRLDWNSDIDKNVHISSEKVFNTSDGCNEGLKLKGKAYSKYVGFIDFNHNSTIFTYYCNDNNIIYGKSYSQNLGTQVFNGIKIKKIKDNKLIQSILNNKGIVNDTEKIKENNFVNVENNWNNNNIGGGDKYEIEKNIKENKGILDNNLNNYTNSENTFWLIK